MELTAHSEAPERSRRGKAAAQLEFSDIVSACVIFASVVITLLEACFISWTAFRLFSNGVQALFAVLFCSQQAYRLYGAMCEGSDGLESVRGFFTKGKDAYWNIFDLVLNVLSILDIVVDTWEGRFVHGLATMRVVRAFRLFRIFASSKFLNDFSRVMHTAVLQMVNFCLVILFALVLASVVATNMLWDFPNQQVAQSYSDLGTTMWTLFKIMTMDGWISSIEPCLALHPSLLYFFALFVFFGLSSISIVPAIFIELLIEDREKRKQERRKRKRRERQAIERAMSRRELGHMADTDSDSLRSESSESTGSERHWRREVNDVLQELKTTSLGHVGASEGGGRRKRRFSRRRSEYYSLEEDDLGSPVAKSCTEPHEAQGIEAVCRLQLEMQALHGQLMAQLAEIREDLQEHRAQSLRERFSEALEAQSEPGTVKEP